MSDQTEQGKTVLPEVGLKLLEDAKKSIYHALGADTYKREQPEMTPASALATAIVGYSNAVARIAALEAEVATIEKLKGLLRVLNDQSPGAIEWAEEQLKEEKAEE